MNKSMNSRQFREEIVGKQISAVIARPGREGQPPVVLMLRFEDGSVVEFVSPRSDRLLRRELARSRQAGTRSDSACGQDDGAQLSLAGIVA